MGQKFEIQSNMDPFDYEMIRLTSSPACLNSEAGVFLSMERAGVTEGTMGLPPGDGTEAESQENNTTTSSISVFFP